MTVRAGYPGRDEPLVFEKMDIERNRGALLEALCTSDTRDEHADVLIESVECLTRGEHVAAGGEDLLLLRSCARALATRLGEAAAADGRLGRVVETICGAILSLASTGPSASEFGGADTTVDVVDVLSSLFEYLRGIRVRLIGAGKERGASPSSKSLPSTPATAEMIMQPIAAAIRGYVNSPSLTREGFVKAVQLHPAVALESLLGLYADQDKSQRSGDGEDRRKACLLACIDGREVYGGVMRHAPDLLAIGDKAGCFSRSSLTPLESSLAQYAYENIADCHRVLQQLSACVELDEGQKGMVGGAIELLTRRVLERKGKEDDPMIIEEAVENFEEGELLVSVCKSEADVRRKAAGPKQEVQALVPRCIGCGVVVRGLLLEPNGGSGSEVEAVGEEVVRRQCDAFAAVKRVTLEGGDDGEGIESRGNFLVEMTSMPGAMRCYEAMCLRERRFWGEIGPRLVGVPQVEMMGVDRGAAYRGLFFEGVESIEQEDRLKEILGEKGLPLPGSLVPVGAGVKGVVLCFQKEEDAKRVYEGLDGKVEAEDTSDGRRKREAGDAPGEAEGEEPPSGAKRARTDRQAETQAPAHPQTIYKILRNRQYQGSFHLEILDGAGRLDVDWPSTLDASQRVDIRYLYKSLTAPSSRLRVGALWPIDDEDKDGLRKLDGYLRQKGRAGVVVLGRRTLYLIPPTTEACACLRVKEFYGRDPSSAMICAVVDE